VPVSSSAQAQQELAAEEDDAVFQFVNGSVEETKPMAARPRQGKHRRTSSNYGFEGEVRSCLQEANRRFCGFDFPFNRVP
jgi:hypothetical protein